MHRAIGVVPLALCSAERARRHVDRVFAPARLGSTARSAQESGFDRQRRGRPAISMRPSASLTIDRAEAFRRIEPAHQEPAAEVYGTYAEPSGGAARGKTCAFSSSAEDGVANITQGGDTSAAGDRRGAGGECGFGAAIAVTS